MKAEHRKELHTNLLADRMGRLVQGVRAGQTPKSAIIWVISGLTVATAIGWYVAGRAGAKTGAVWVSLSNSERDPVALKAISEDNAGTMPGRTARFQRARLLLGRGLESIYSNVGMSPADAIHDRSRTDSVKDLEDARKLFRDLIAECSKHAILEQEALMNAAMAEEALATAPKPGDGDGAMGSLDEALTLYKRLADSYPTTDLGKQAAARCQDLETNRAQVNQFYDAFRDEVHKRTKLKSPPAFEP
jgi:hypothetical protein